jgi:Domain of unknown function (DUF4388)/Inner membrane component of T3SS, cytoplasmic domain
MSSTSLQGSLDSFKLPDVLAFLNSAKKTGMLTVTADEREAYVFFRAGAVVYAASNQRTLRLGAILLKKKILTREQCDAIDELVVRGGRFGDLIVEQGILTAEQLDDFLKIQVSEVIYDCFVWKKGSFAFFDGIDLPLHAVTISIDLTNLIMEGARRIEEWEQCFRLLPDSSVVFRAVSSPDAEKITLSLDEWKILFLINGQRTLEDICRDIEDEAFKVYRVVYGLYSNKLIEPVRVPAIAVDAPTVPVRRPVDEETLRKHAVESSGDETILDGDDTHLLISPDARLTLKDVVKTTVAQIAIVAGEGAGTVFPLTEAAYLIGRASDAAIQLLDLGVSGRHARIYRGPDGYVIEDLKSRNGTWVNRMRVANSLLCDGDRLRVGTTDLRYEVLYDGARADAAATVINLR